MTLVYHSSKLKATVDLLLSKSVVKHFALSSVRKTHVAKNLCVLWSWNVAYKIHLALLSELMCVSNASANIFK